LVLGTDGDFYGAGSQGGTYNDGTIFRMTPAGDVTVIYNFTGQSDGYGPNSLSPLVQGVDGFFYGTGEGPGLGTVFKISSSGAFTVIYSFPNSDDAQNPNSGLVQGSDGALYGTTAYETPDGIATGSVYKVTLAGAQTTLHAFTGDADGGRPIAALLLAGDGNFYGTTAVGGDLSSCQIQYGTDGCGTAFSVSASGTFSTIFVFSDSIAYPTGTFIQSTEGKLVGSAFGSENIFELSLSSSPPPPVQLSISPSSIIEGESATLSWKVLNAFSATLQQCYASVQGSPTGGGAWSGLQKGVLANGVYSGSSQLTPTAAGTYTYALTCGGSESGFATLTVGVPPALTITTTSLPNSTFGVSYSTTLNATGGVPPYAWSLLSGQLPGGLSLSASSGTISGTPTQAGSESFDVQVEDSASSPNTASASLTLTVDPAQPTIVVAPTTIKIASPGDSESGTVTISGFSSNSITFSCSGLPAEARCSFGTLSGSGNSGTTTMQISTTASSAANAIPGHVRGGARQLLALALPGMLAIIGLSSSRRRHSWQQLCVLSIVLVSAALFTGCGGSSNAKSGGTPVGTSTVTVKASAGSQTATATLQFVVQ
jgi:uncharacterized repeat protein (TIGR03803 family)